MTQTYGDLCEAIIKQLRNDPELDRYYESVDTIDVDRETVDLGLLTIMGLARFISGISGRMGWVQGKLCEEPIGFVRRNGAGEVVFQQGHPSNFRPPWRPVFLPAPPDVPPGGTREGD